MKTQTQSQNAVDELLTVDELATLLKVKKTWIYGRIHARNLPFDMLKVGHYPRFPLSSVRRFLESQIVQGSVA